MARVSLPADGHPGRPRRAHPGRPRRRLRRRHGRRARRARATSATARTSATPCCFNELLHDFAARAYGRPAQRPPWRRAIHRPRRALYVSSPIGLGHAWRDVAIARELRALHPDLQIDWLAQDPVTRVLETSGERIHPASALLANESRHIAAESREHELNVFQAWRRMDEILLANFMVFRDLVRDEPYDLWIGDEAWELDYYLHENPELKSTPYAFLTDFVGWLPMPEGGDDEARLTADYNAEMIEQIARFPSRARPRDLRRRARRRRPARLRRRPAGDRPLGAGALRLQRLRAGARRRRAGRPRRRCAPSSATGPTRSCAWSRSAARASARACCAA